MPQIPQLSQKTKNPKRMTRQDDAESIVGKILAAELENEANHMNPRSLHALVEMSETGLPYGGAVTLKEAQAYLQRTQAKYRALDALQVFTAIVQNILERDDILDKKGALEQAVDDFRKAVSAEKMLGILQKSGVQVGKTAREIVRQYLYPQGLSAKSAVAKSLHMQPRQETKPRSVRQIVNKSVGLEQLETRKALASQAHSSILKGMGLDLSGFNPNSVHNVVNRSVGLRPEFENKPKPKSIRQVVDGSVR